MKLYKFCFAVIAFALLFCACAKQQKPTESTTEALTVSQQSEQTDTTATAQTTTKKAAETTSAVPNNNDVATTKGSMYITTSADNTFISAIASKYGIDPSRLACYYTSTDEDRNYVWQFTGETDSNGKVIKTAETLEKVYIVSHDCNTVKYTDGKNDNSGLTYSYGIIIFEMTKELFIPKCQAEIYS